MKTLTQKEITAKFVGNFINAIIAIAGAMACVYGLFIWAQHNL